MGNVTTPTETIRGFPEFICEETGYDCDNRSIIRTYLDEGSNPSISTIMVSWRNRLAQLTHNQ